MECPTVSGIKASGSRFCNIMQDGGPAQPEVGSVFADVVQNFYRVFKIILMSFSLFHLHACQTNHLWEYNFQQSTLKQQPKADGRFVETNEFMQFIRDAFCGNHTYAFSIFHNSCKGIFLYRKL